MPASDKLYFGAWQFREQSRFADYAMELELNHSSGGVLGFHVQNIAFVGEMKGEPMHLPPVRLGDSSLLSNRNPAHTYRRSKATLALWRLSSAHAHADQHHQ